MGRDLITGVIVLYKVLIKEMSQDTLNSLRDHK